MRQYFSFTLTIRAIILIVFLSFLFGCQNETGTGPMAPDFLLDNLAGKKVGLKEFRGKVVILDFWATWCPPCRTAIPELVDLQDKYKGKGLVILGISTDIPNRVSDEKLRAFGKRFKINYPILRYNLNVVENYFGRQAPSLPTMYVIDRKGRVRDKIVGHNSEAIKKSVEGLL